MRRYFSPLSRWFVAAAVLLIAAVAMVAFAEQGSDDAGQQGPPGGADAPPGGGGPPQGPPPALVQVQLVTSQQVQDQWDVVGRLVEVRRAVVAAEQSGRVIEVEPEQGDPVKAGRTALARIDDVWARLALRSAKADLQQEQARVLEEAARLDQATRDLTFLEDLLKSNSAKPKEVSDARSTVAEKQAALAVAQAASASAEVQVARCREDLSRLTVVAPFDGVVVAKLTEVGQWVTPGAPVAEIISVGRIDAVIDVPERLVNFLEPGVELEVLIDALGVTATGKVAAITPLGSNAARTFPVKVRCDDRKGKFKPGMSVTAHVPTGKRVESLTVPRDAVKRTPSGTVVWANLDGQAMPIGVKVLFGVGDRYAVVPVGGGPPLLPGGQVVTEGAERLFPTQPLIVTNQAPPAETAAAGNAPPQPARP